MPPPGCGEDLTRRHALGVDTYDMYCAYTSATVAVDLRATTHALTRLIGSAPLRRTMGESGRQHVCSHFDWRVIIPRYEQLWSDLNSRRVSDECSASSTASLGRNPHPWPARIDPFYGFASYPTAKLKQDSVVKLHDASARIAVRRLRSCLNLEMVKYVAPLMASQQDLELLLQQLETGPAAVHHLLQKLGAKPEESPIFHRSVAWLMKLGILVFVYAD